MSEWWRLQCTGGQFVLQLCMCLELLWATVPAHSLDSGQSNGSDKLVLSCSVQQLPGLLSELQDVLLRIGEHLHRGVKSSPFRHFSFPITTSIPIPAELGSEPVKPLLKNKSDCKP
jgi:hypothetical protein